MSQSLLLDRSIWDLCLDANRNIAIASNPYAMAQDVACAIRLFLGELYYDTSKGVPYFDQILGQQPPISVTKQQIEKAALTVNGVISPKVFITSFEGRTVTGQCQFTDANGVLNKVNF